MERMSLLLPFTHKRACGERMKQAEGVCFSLCERERDRGREGKQLRESEIERERYHRERVCERERFAFPLD